MKIIKIFIFFSFLSSASLFASNSVLENNVDYFVKNIENCKYFSGEITGEESDRQTELINKANKSCAQAKKGYSLLRKKYKNSKYVRDILKPYKKDIDDIN